MADDVLVKHKGVKPVVPLVERLEIVRDVRYVDAAHAALTTDKVAIWKELRFNVMFKGGDWKGTEKGLQLERSFGDLGVEIVWPSEGSGRGGRQPLMAGVLVFPLPFSMDRHND
ncbi:MAG TPA: hypothetical protein VN280_08840 [Variovorax sp.]|nr:hypothetical protein [Variovorax sp.]